MVLSVLWKIRFFTGGNKINAAPPNTITINTIIMTSRIYFDNAATTRVDPRVAEAMQPYLHEVFGNPSSLHSEGREARQAISNAREKVAMLVGSKSDEVIFTASGTEADNMAIMGVFRAFAEQEKSQEFHLITSSIEHPAILEVCTYLESCGANITYLPVSHDGIIEPESLEKAFRPETKLVSIMAANNVVGTIQPIAEFARITHMHNALFHTDAVQAIGKVPINFHSDKIDLLSLSAHKIHGPKGIGALILKNGIPFKPLIHGGGQEKGLRPATENLAGIVGLGKSAEICVQEMPEESARTVQLRELLIKGIIKIFSNAYLIGHRYKRLPGHLCFGFQGLEGEAIKMLMALDEKGIAVSSGSACSSHKSSGPSYVLTAMGFDPFQSRGSLRITLSRFNTQSEIEKFLEVLPGVMENMRAITSRAK